MIVKKKIRKILGYFSLGQTFTYMCGDERPINTFKIKSYKLKLDNFGISVLVGKNDYRYIYSSMYTPRFVKGELEVYYNG